MKTWIVSYADGNYSAAQEQLMASAARVGIDERRAWSKLDIDRSMLARTHRTLLDASRGSGYWVWKPFIIKETLKEMAVGDVLIYADAGIDIVADLAPLFEISRRGQDILLFAGHYDDCGPNLCGHWTKRDCFVFMDCDEPRYHGGQLLDASFMLFTKSERAIAFVREWFLYCAQSQVLTDAANVCGLPDTPGFVEHRHDQSILSLLAIRNGLPSFRHPSQHGNHLKEARFRTPGEWLRHPYGSQGVFGQSPYGTLLDHHRGTPTRADCVVELRRTLPARCEQVYAAWTSADSVSRWAPLGRDVVRVDADVRVDGRYDITLMNSAGTMRLFGTYLEVEPPRRLVYNWRWQTTVTVDFAEYVDGTEITLRHGAFPSELMRDAHNAAWGAFFDSVAATLHATKSETVVIEAVAPGGPL